MTKKQKHTLALAVTLLVVVAAMAILVPKLLKKDFRAELAKVLSEDPKSFVLNVPPASGLVPGSVFLKDNLRLIPLKRTPRTDESITQGNSFDLDWAQLAGSSGKGNVGTGSLGALFGDTEAANLQVRAKDCRILDMDLDKIKQRLKNTDLMDLTADQTKQIAVVTHAYEGILETKITRKSKTNAEAWKKVQENATKTGEASSGAGNAAIEIKSNTDDEINFAWKEPVIFACSVQSVSYIASHLGSEPDKIELKEVPGETLLIDPQGLLGGPPTSTRATEAPWALLTIASGHYPKNHNLRQDWNAMSAEVFESSLHPWKPVLTHRIWASNSDPLERTRLLASLGDFFPEPVPPGLNGR